VFLSRRIAELLGDGNFTTPLRGPRYKIRSAVRGLIHLAYNAKIAKAFVESILEWDTCRRRRRRAGATGKPGPGYYVAHCWYAVMFKIGYTLNNLHEMPFTCFRCRCIRIEDGMSSQKVKFEINYYWQSLPHFVCDPQNGCTSIEPDEVSVAVAGTLVSNVANRSRR